MILMRMADQNRGRSSPVERGRKQSRRPVRRIQRPAGIEKQAFARGMNDLDAAPANLPGAAMNSESEAYGSTSSFMSSGLSPLTIWTWMPRL